MHAKHSFLIWLWGFADKVQTFKKPYVTLTVVNKLPNSTRVMKVTILASKIQYDIETATKIAENWQTGETAWAIIPPYCCLCDGGEKQPEQSHVIQADCYNQLDDIGTKCAPSHQNHISFYIAQTNLMLLFSSTFSGNSENHSHNNPQTRKKQRCRPCWQKPALITCHHHNFEMNTGVH